MLLLALGSPMCHAKVPAPGDAAVCEGFLLDEVRFLCNDAARAASDDSGCIAVSQVFLRQGLRHLQAIVPAPERFDEMDRSGRSCLCGVSGCGG